MRIIRVVAGAAAAAMLLAAGTAAYAAGEATLKVSSTTVYQGGKVYLSAKCQNPSYYPVLNSALFAGGTRIGSPGHGDIVQVNVSTTKTPRTYPIKLSCESLVKEILRHTHGTATVDVTVLKPTSSTTPATIASSGGKPLGTTTAIVETGLGGMAGQVAAHHPAG